MDSVIRSLILEDEEYDSRPLSSSEPLLAGESREMDDAAHRESLTAIHHCVNRRFLLLSGPALLLCTFVVGFDISFLSTNYSRRIASGLNDLNNAGWIILAGSISETACQPLHGHISQIYGRRPATLVASAAMTIGLLCCALSNRLWQLSLSRVTVGTGSSGLQLLVVVIINDLVKLQDLPLWKSIVVITETFALMLGGPLSSLFTDQFGWRSTFGLEFSFMFVALTAVYFMVHVPSIKKPLATAGSVDFLGAISLFVAIATPLFAINLGGNILSWSHPIEIFLFFFTPFALGLFYFIETKVAVFPIIPSRFIKMASVIAVVACAFPVVFAFNQLIYTFALYIEVRSLDRLSRFNDWALACVYVGRPIGAVLAGLFVKRYLRFKLMLQSNILVSILIYFSFAFGWIHPDNPAFVPFLLMIGLNLGISEGCLLVALIPLVPKEDQSQLYAFFDLTIALAGDMGIAISLAVTHALIKSNLVSVLGDSPPTKDIIRKSLENLDYVRALPSNLHQPVVHAFISSIEKVFGLSALALMVSAIATLFMYEMPQS